MVMVTVMSILIAMALPIWSQAIQRQKEKELIFRGLQYAEAIRVFQLRVGRYTVSLRELLENEPRAIRQLWTDPFRDDGVWGLVLAQTTQSGQQVSPQQVSSQQLQQLQQGGSGLDPDTDDPEDDSDNKLGEDGEPIIPTEDVSEEGKWAGGLSEQGAQATGPIVGVRSISKSPAVGMFMGGNATGQWQFTADLIPLLPNPGGLESIPRLTSDYIGRTFPSGLSPQQGSAPVDDFEEARNANRDRDSRRSRADDRQNQRRDGSDNR